MRTFRGVGAMRRWSRACRAAGESVGFVPTMGALHRGHLRLVERAVAENPRAAASIFVNPIQFGPGEDFRAYPRDLARDRRLLRQAGCQALLLPSNREMYPPEFQTRVHVGELSGPLCGRFRPGHFEGVATVVAKLLAIVEPDRLYLGQKDYQQSLVIRRMVEDLNFPVRVVTVPTVREPDGLAMSSRNQYLTPEERRRAPGLYAALRSAAESVRGGDRSALRVRARTMRALERVGKTQYVEVLDARTLRESTRLSGRIVIAAAVFVGRARLIDNVLVMAS